MSQFELLKKFIFQFLHRSSVLLSLTFIIVYLSENGKISSTFFAFRKKNTFLKMRHVLDFLLVENFNELDGRK